MSSPRAICYEEGGPRRRLPFVAAMDSLVAEEDAANGDSVKANNTLDDAGAAVTKSTQNVDAAQARLDSVEEIKANAEKAQADAEMAAQEVVEQEQTEKTLKEVASSHIPSRAHSRSSRLV